MKICYRILSINSFILQIYFEIFFIGIGALLQQKLGGGGGGKLMFYFILTPIFDDSHIFNFLALSLKIRKLIDYD